MIDSSIIASCYSFAPRFAFEVSEKIVDLIYTTCLFGRFQPITCQSVAMTPYLRLVPVAWHFAKQRLFAFFKIKFDEMCLINILLRNTVTFRLSSNWIFWVKNTFVNHNANLQNISGWNWEKMITVKSYSLETCYMQVLKTCFKKIINYPILEQCEDEHPKCDVLKEYCNKHKVVKKKLCKNTCGECSKF